MRIIFFGADRWFSEPVLGALTAAGFEVPVVVTKGDALTKNKKQKTKNKVYYLQAKTPEDISRRRLVSLLRSDLLRSDLGRSDLLDPEAIVVASFGPPFLPAEILNWPKYGCLNVHASLLPRWRGASPVFAALAAGDKETGASIMRMTEGVDRGPTLGMAKTEIRQPKFPRTLPGGLSLGESPWDNRETLTKRLGKLGGELIVETLKKLETGQITEVRQPEKSPTFYTRRLTKESGRINWSQSPIEIERFIRAVTPWPGAWTEYKDEGRPARQSPDGSSRMAGGRTKDEGKVIKILKAHLEKLPQRDCHGRLGRSRNDVTLVINLLQLPGKNPVSWHQFLAGHPGAKLR